MPVIDFSELSGERPVAPLESTTSLPTGTVVRDFLRNENGLFNASEGIGNLMFNKFEEEPEYDPETDMHGYEGYADDLRGARSRKEMSFLKGKIDDENRRRESFAMGTGLQKAAAIGSLIATDPLSLVPVAGDRKSVV